MSFISAKIVTSSQTGIHKKLKDTLTKHTRCAYRKPIAPHTQEAFEFANNSWLERGKPSIVLDSACGTAESTHYLANQHPNALVIGLDRSQQRLSHHRNTSLPNNTIVLRCDCTDFWRLAAQTGWLVDWHYLLYPNPYPKADQLKRRWHGHPSFMDLLAISQGIKLRTNWRIYAEEFCQSLLFLGYGQGSVREYFPDAAITAFERKYWQSQHPLWEVFVTSTLPGGWS